MSLYGAIKAAIPEPIKRVIRPIVYGPPVKDTKEAVTQDTKYESELAFWRSRVALDNGTLKNSHFEKIMLGMAGESSDDFLRGKVVADFGCGPRGSLVWAKSASLRIGIDVLADLYADEFKANIISHGMIYLKSTESVIPLPSDFCDVVFTLNAIDHVDNFPVMCAEIMRVLKPGGLFIGSFNLNEPPTYCEPQQLTEELVREHLLKHLEIETYRVTKQGPLENQYGPFYDGNLSYEPGERAYLWARASKRQGNSHST